MSENNQPNSNGSISVQNSEAEKLARRKRINRLKKIIIVTALVLIIIPIILSIILFIKVIGLQKQLDELLVLKNTGQIVATVNDVGQVRYTYANLSEVVESNAQAEDKNEADKNNQMEQEINSGEKDVGVDEQESSSDIEAVKNPDESESAGQSQLIDTGKYAYLTFDDGPSEQTEKIIKILDEYNVTATFFVVGKEDEESLKRYKMIVDSGNAIGLHSYSHDYYSIYESLDNFKQDLKRISDLVYNATGVRSKLYRFPGGSSNAIADDISIYTKYLTENGYTYYDWNSSSRDAAAVMPPKEDIISVVTADAKNYDNMVVLMHDSAKKESTVEALPELIEKLKDMGFTIKKIDENSIPVQHR